MRVAVIGGGFTGLALGYYLGKTHDVTIFEKEGYLGGLASSVRVGGSLIERYYHHIFRHETAVQELCQELGIGIGWHSSRVGMYWGGRIFGFGTPKDLLLMPGLSIIDKLRLGLFTLTVPRIRDWRRLEGIAAEKWLVRNLGKNTFEVIWKHLLMRKFGPEHYHDVPASYVWERLGMRTSSKANLLEGEKLGYLDGSFQAVVDALESRIASTGGTIIKGRKVDRILAQGGKVKGVKTGRRTYRFDAVISTLPLPIFAGIAPDLAKGYLAGLSQIRYSGVATLMLRLRKRLSSFYWTNIHDLACPFGLMVEHTNLMPSSMYGCHVVYLSSYVPSSDEGFFSLGDEEVFRRYAGYLKRMFPGFGEGDVMGWQLFRQRYANPVISLDYSRKMPGFETPIEGLYVVERSQLALLQQGTDNCVRLAQRFLSSTRLNR